MRSELAADRRRRTTTNIRAATRLRFDQHAVVALSTFPIRLTTLRIVKHGAAKTGVATRLCSSNIQATSERQIAVAPLSLIAVQSRNLMGAHPGSGPVLQFPSAVDVMKEA
jgi:hypothetical protein